MTDTIKSMIDKQLLNQYKKQRLYYITMRSNYKIKLLQLQTFGNLDRIPQRVKETEDSIKLLDKEIKELNIKIKTN